MVKEIKDVEINKKLVERLYGIPWFQNCGDDIPSLGIRVLSKEEVIKFNSSIKWGNTVLDFQSDLTVACYGNEIDDLFVSESNLRHGYGRKLLIWALNQIASRGYKKCVVHVAEWNQGAVRMYLNEGFKIVKKEIISI